MQHTKFTIYNTKQGLKKTKESRCHNDLSETTCLKNRFNNNNIGRMHASEKCVVQLVMKIIIRG